MTSSVRWSASDWQRVSALGADLMLHSAASLGIRGDVDSLMTWVTHGQDLRASGSSVHGWTKDWTHGVRMSLRAPYEPGLYRDIPLKNMTMMVAVALSMRSDGLMSSGEVSASSIEAVFGECIQAPRTTWSRGEDALVRAGIGLWRDEPEALVGFFIACCRFIRHPGFVDAFVSEGVELEWLVNYEQFDDLREGQQPQDLPTPLGWMLFNGNFAGAASLIRQLEPNGRAHDPAWLLRALADPVTSLARKRVKTLHSSVSNRMTQEAETASRNGGFDSNTCSPVTEDLLELMRALDAWARERPGWQMRAEFLVQHLEKIDALGIPSSAGMVNAFLNDVPADGLSLATALGCAFTQEIKDPEPNLRLLLALIQRASSSHIAPVLVLCSEWLSVRDPSSLEAFAAAASLDSTRKKTPLVLNDLRDTLSFLMDSGLDRTGRLHVVAGGSLLHRLAASSHPQMCSALSVFLELGMDPMLRDEVNRLPSSKIIDPLLKAQWSSIVSSFAARKAAEDTLASFPDSANSLR